jgi:hypothetical protein
VVRVASVCARVHVGGGYPDSCLGPPLLRQFWHEVDDKVKQRRRRELLLSKHVSGDGAALNDRYFFSRRCKMTMSSHPPAEGDTRRQVVQQNAVAIVGVAERRATW